MTKWPMEELVPDLVFSHRRQRCDDVFKLGRGRRLLVASDDIEINDQILREQIPDFGRLRTLMSAWWMHELAPTTRADLITTDLAEAVRADRRLADLNLQKNRSRFVGRIKLYRHCKMSPIKCIVRGYLTGSAWQDYDKTGTICGTPLPDGLTKNEKLAEPMFTPTLLNDVNKTIHVSPEHLTRLIDAEQAILLQENSLRLYHQAAEHALQRGVILADACFTWGFDPNLTLAGEVLTPACARYWPLDQYRVGLMQPSMDLDHLRIFLDACGGYDEAQQSRNYQPVLNITRDQCIEGYELITQQDFPWK